MIKVKDLTYSYKKGVDVLKNVDLEFEANNNYAIIGENGAGKTTLVKILKKILKVPKGKIEVDGINFDKCEVYDIASKISLVFQNPNDQIFNSDMMKEILFGCKNLGKDLDECEKNAILLLKELDMYEKININTGDLSLSEKKILSIISVLLMDTDVIIFDEPTISLDYSSVVKLEKIIQKLKDNGKTIICITHDMDFVCRNFENVIAMAKGEVIIQGSALEVFNDAEALNIAKVKVPYIGKLSKHYFNEIHLTIDEFVSKYELHNK